MQDGTLFKRWGHTDVVPWSVLDYVWLPRHILASIPSDDMHRLLL